MMLFYYIGIIAFFICYIPQIIKTYKTKNVKGISPYLYIIEFIGLFSMLLFSITTNNKPFVLNYAITSIMSATILYGVYKYR